MSRQREWQLRQETAGNCVGCGRELAAAEKGEWKKCFDCRGRDKLRGIRDRQRRKDEAKGDL